MCSFQAKVDILNKLEDYGVVMNDMNVNNVAFTLGSSENFCRDATKGHLYIGNCTTRTSAQANTTVSVTTTYLYVLNTRAIVRICIFLHIVCAYVLYIHIIYRNIYCTYVRTCNKAFVCTVYTYTSCSTQMQHTYIHTYRF